MNSSLPSGVKPFWKFLYSGFEDEPDLEILRKIITLNIIIIVGTFFCGLLGGVALVQHNFPLAIGDLFVLVALAGIFYHLRISKVYNQSAILGSTLMGIFYAFLMILGSVENSAYLWLLTYPPTTVLLLGMKKGTNVAFGFIFAMAIIMILRSPLGIPASYSNALLIRFFAVYIAIFLISYAMEYMRLIVQQKYYDKNLDLEKLNQQNCQLIDELQQSIIEVKHLQGILPICANCKKIRNDEGYWEQVEEYVRGHSDVRFSHSICPSCREELYSGIKKNNSGNP